jgi:tetratricopeptide (TPR) repeat protein
MSTEVTPPFGGLDDVPQKDLSFLLSRDHFRPIPTAAIPQAFLTSPEAAKPTDSVAELVQKGQFYAAAVVSARQLVSLPTTAEQATIFNLIYTRLACLTLINKVCQEQAAVESTVLGDLTSAFYRHPITNVHIVPWDLRVLAVRLQSIGFKDWRRGIMGYYQLAQDARQEILRDRQENKGQEETIWASRLRDLGIRVASMLVEMGDLEAAGGHLRTLEVDPRLDEAEKRRFATMETLVWLQIGDMWAAKRCLSRLYDGEGTEDLQTRLLQCLVNIGDGNFTTAVKDLQSLHEEMPNDTMISHNLAVCLLYTGRMKEARDMLEKAVEATDTVPFPSLLFNLCTIYELCTERARDMKTRLAERVASRQPTASGWEKASVHFKMDGVRA